MRSWGLTIKDSKVILTFKSCTNKSEQEPERVIHAPTFQFNFAKKKKKKKQLIT